MGLGFAEGHKRRDITIMVKHGVHFDTGFAASERGPGENRQAQADGGGINAEQFGFETKLVAGRLGQATPVHTVKQFLEKADRSLFVGIGHRGSGH
jgi:hypothetical protein